jgi:hypothetical protein
MAYPFVSIAPLGHFGEFDPIKVCADFGGQDLFRLILPDDVIIQKGFQLLRF